MGRGAAGPRVVGPEAAGPGGVRPRAAGPGTVGPDAAGPGAVRPDAVGWDAAGTGAAGAGGDVPAGDVPAGDVPAGDVPGADGSGAGGVLVPLLLSRGHHVRHDIPAAAAAAARPGRPLRVAAPLGPHPLLTEALCARLTETGWPVGAGAGAGAGHGVVLAAAGSRDPAAAVDTRRAAALLARRLGVPVVPAYAAPTEHTPTTVPAALRALAARGVRHTAVAAYFTAPGRFATQAADAAPGRAAAPLGAHPALAALLLHRYDQARATAARGRALSV
ncbi:sirohydrochlorin chelatase [Streptomyces sp. NPDC017941]|uniref:sirohydrochlorin chelatase n=1 Tax=Streptomyces sp. NPDC017941 TaxID=3365018 RepID=UPI00379E5F0C